MFGTIFIIVRLIFASFHLLVVIYLKFDISGPIFLLKIIFSLSNHHFYKFSWFGNYWLTPRHDDFLWQAEILLCQQEILLGQDEILLSQADALIPRGFNTPRSQIIVKKTIRNLSMKFRKILDQKISKHLQI